MNDYNLEICKGCPGNQFHDCPMYAFNSFCPCLKCLVKVTCRIACEDYNNFEERRYQQSYHKRPRNKS